MLRDYIWNAKTNQKAANNKTACGEGNNTIIGDWVGWRGRMHLIAQRIPRVLAICRRSISLLDFSRGSTRSSVAGALSLTVPCSMLVIATLAEPAAAQTPSPSWSAVASLPAIRGSLAVGV